MWVDRWLGNMWSLRCVIFIGIFFAGTVVEGARILVLIPTISYSHHINVRPIIRALAKEHQVISMTSEPMILDSSLANVTQISLKHFNELVRKLMTFERRDNWGIGQWQFMQRHNDVSVQIMAEIYEMPAMQALIHNTTTPIDLVIGEWPFALSLLYFASHYNASLVGFSSMDLVLVAQTMLGNPIHPGYMSQFLLPFSRPKTFLERLYSTLYVGFMSVVVARTIARHDELGRKHFGEKYTPMWDSKPDLVLSCTHWMITGPRPTVPGYIELGGNQLADRLPLEPELKEFADNSPEGLIVMSFGSNVMSSLLDGKILKAIFHVFSTLPYRIIWKLELDQLLDYPNNVKIVKWMSQNELLAHPNTVLFITHGGHNSMRETIINKVPVVGIPFFGDQFWNIDRLVDLGVGEMLTFVDNFDSDKFREAILRVITNKTYYEKISKISDIMQDQPMKPLDKALFWIEYALRHKGTVYMRSPLIGYTFADHVMLDVVVFILIATAVIIYMFIFGLRLLIAAWCGRNNVIKLNKKIE